jgi:hypothetical protein
MPGAYFLSPLPALKVFCRTGWKACATDTFMVLGEPKAHEWLVPKLCLFPSFPSSAWERNWGRSSAAAAGAPYVARHKEIEQLTEDNP